MHCLRVSVVCFAWLAMAIGASHAAETVQFEDARFRAGLTARQAVAMGMPVFPPSPVRVQGYLQKPAGSGPFPALIALHGCAGMGTLFDPRLKANSWPDALTSWGYAVLLVDSFVLRGVGDTCNREAGAFRVQDAYGALLFLSKQPDIDATRIALLGFSAGGIATLVALRRDMPGLFDLPPGLDFKAGIAFYPCFGSSLDSTKPILILNGEADDWSRQSVCQSMMAMRPAAATSIRLVSFPNAFHDFDRPPMTPGRMAFGHWLEYNADAAQRAAEEIREFLNEHLKGGASDASAVRHDK